MVSLFTKHLVFGALFVMCLTACNGETPLTEDPSQFCDPEIAKAELYALKRNLDLWDVLRSNDIESSVVDRTLAETIVGHIVTLRAAQFSIDELPGLPLETLCKSTTNEVRQIINLTQNDALKTIALVYLDEIEPEVIGRVREIQKSMLGTECSLSP